MLSGYQFTQGFAAANLSRLRAEVAAPETKREAVIAPSEELQP